MSMTARQGAAACWAAAGLAAAYGVAAAAQVIYLDHALDRVVVGIWAVVAFWLLVGIWCWRQARGVQGSTDVDKDNQQ